MQGKGALVSWLLELDTFSKKRPVSLQLSYVSNQPCTPAELQELQANIRVGRQKALYTFGWARGATYDRNNSGAT
eukprot:9500940-Pyramimonas_sp.AAC.1